MSYYDGKWKEIMEKYNIKGWKDQYKMQCSFLDKIDMQPYIDKYDDLDDLWAAIENDYDDTELSNCELLDGYIFNWFNRHDLSKYIKEKYNIYYRSCEYTKYLR